jgi:vacuolar-type H+-ATPase subunit I/STV1
VVPKKSIFEKLGLIEPKVTDNEEEKKEIVTQTENIPDPEHVPDLRNLDFEEEKPKVEVMTKVKEEEPVSTPNEISDKLDLIIGAYEKNKMLTIDEIYRNAHLDSEVKKTIFMTDVYLKAIPENLPLDIKRETVLNIMKVSNIGLDDLLSDAYKRIDSLNTVLEETVSTTQEVFDRNDATIRELEKRIEDLKDVNKNRKKFQEDQNTMIEYEIQKIINLVEFVKPKK